MRLLTALIFTIFLSLQCSADLQIDRLDDVISRREIFVKLKQQRTDSLRSLISDEDTPEEKLRIYMELFNEYLTFNFDSTMKYVGYAENIASPMNDYNLGAQIKIHHALSLATSGHFSHAADILNKIDSRKLSIKGIEEYYIACECTYGSWAEYSEKRIIAPELTRKSLDYLDSLISVTPLNTPEYYYRTGEKALRTKDYLRAQENNLKALKHLPVDCRIYAQASYSLALAYKGAGNKDKYKEWLINAAISDQMVPLKENLALQQLAMYLKTEEGDLTRANRYLKLALEDAVFYNNRLRMLEIAEKIPDIANVYQETIEDSNLRLKRYLFIIGLLVLLLAFAVAYVYRQQKKVSDSKKILSELNDKLKILNQQLSITNRSREQYVSLFLDLCAAYIEKLNRFPTILKLKVRQLSDVTSVADRYVRPTEAETKEMFFNFDSAFLRLYPDFVSRFNSLLQDGKQILPKKGELLNTDLRIYALVRMGITDSNKIATLLFLSPQTIFNHRTQVRNRAIDRDNFEKDVLNICATLPERNDAD